MFVCYLLIYSFMILLQSHQVLHHIQREQNEQ